MTEIKKTLAILKARWPEVALIIAVSLSSFIFNRLMVFYRNESTPIQKLIELGYLAVILLILFTLIIGFQKTVYLEDEKRQSPMVLLKMGMPFLGRMLRLVLLWFVICYVLIWLTFSITKLLTPVNTGFFETAQSSPLLYQFYFTVPSLILIKPTLLIPAIIIILDCKVLESFKYMKKCKLLDAKGLLILFVIATAFSFLWAFLPNSNEVGAIFWYILIIVQSIVGSIISLMIAVTSVRFVASQNLVYDKPQVSENVDFEDLRRYSNRNPRE